MTKQYSIYSDGNYFPRAKKSGFGGYIKDPNGQILVEYTEQIRQSQYIYNFEPLGIIRGLQLAQSMGLKNIVSYCDDKNTIVRIEEIMSKNNDTSYLPASAKPELFDEILNLSKSFDSFKFEYIPRNLNKHSDALSRRYSNLMEQNFMRQYEEDLLQAERVLSLAEEPKNRIFFSHPNLVKMKDKNNPFLVAPTRNKKSRKISKAEQQLPYHYLFIEEIVESSSIISLSAYYYSNDIEKELLLSKEINHENELIKFCQFLKKAISLANKKNNSPIWIYSNNKSINNVFEQKEKLKKDALPAFSDLYKSLNKVPRMLFHNLPFVHEFQPRIASKEKKKSELQQDLETVDFLIDQLQNGLIGRKQNQYFGKLIRYQLRNYRKLLDRDLNGIEKQEIIDKTTNELENKGLSNLPKLQIKP